ncbi:MAG: hypothetical protein HOE90_20335 [Bacteriovoracaceae bacterium]|nr:hypothetical protein [Bacteriovoracaceae bacterium]
MKYTLVLVTLFSISSQLLANDFSAVSLLPDSSNQVKISLTSSFKKDEICPLSVKQINIRPARMIGGQTTDVGSVDIVITKDFSGFCYIGDAFESKVVSLNPGGREIESGDYQLVINGEYLKNIEVK